MGEILMTQFVSKTYRISSHRRNLATGFVSLKNHCDEQDYRICICRRLCCSRCCSRSNDLQQVSQQVMNKLLVVVVSWTAGTALGLLLFNKLLNKNTSTPAPAQTEEQ